MRKPVLVLLALGHMATDLYPGMLSPLLPIIMERYGLSMAMAGTLVMVLQSFSNLSQPVAGILHDYLPGKAYLWFGLLLSALPMAGILHMRTLPLILVALALSGVGVGAFHPAAAVAAGRAASRARGGVSMALFASGGQLGFMAAPLVVVFIIDRFGEQWLPVVAVPAAVMALYFYMAPHDTGERHAHASVAEWFAAFDGNGRELFILWLVSMFRAVVHLLMNSFLPLLAMARGASYAGGALYLAGALMAGTAGMFVGGHLSDRHGRRRMMAVSLFLASPLLLGFLLTRGAVSVVFLLAGMAALTSTIPVNIVLAQRAAPRHAGVASSLVMGLSFAVGALTAPAFGALADGIGIESAALVVAIVPALGGLAVFLLKNE